MFRKLTLYIFLFLSAIGLDLWYTIIYFWLGLWNYWAINSHCSLLHHSSNISDSILRQEISGETTCSRICSNWRILYYRLVGRLWVTARLSSKIFFYRFEDAIMAPLVEEPLKLAAFIFAVYVVPTKSYRGLLLVAITAGLGFQISEDFSYIPFRFAWWFFLYNLRNSWSNYWCCIVSLALHILPRYGASPDMVFTSKTH